MTTKKTQTSTTTNGHKCPECGETFKVPQVLGRHRKFKHGVVGSSPGAIKRAQAQAAAPPPTSYPCPDCGKVYKKPTGLGRHRQAEHGVAGTSKTVMNYHKSKQKPASKRSALAKVPKANGHVNGTHTNHHEEAHVASSDPFDIPVAIAFGRFREICLSMAVEHNLPPRLFASRFAELVYRSTLR